MDSLILSKEQKFLIDRAKEEYPIGTAHYIINCDASSGDPIIENDVTAVAREIRWSTNVNGDFYIDGGKGYIYLRGKWAAKIHSAGVTKDNYLIFT